MSSSSSGGQGQSSASPPEDDAFGPFVTVVSVDGGLQCGNKLTVITPTEICETAKQGKQAVIRKLDTSHDKISSSQSSSSSPLRSSSKLIQPSGNFGKAVNTNNSGNGSIPSSSKQHQQQQRNKHGVETTTTNKMNSASSSVSGSGTAYVTVVALSEEQSLQETTGKGKPKSGIPVRAEPSSLSNKKSVVNICNSTSLTHSAKGPSSSSYLPDATASHSENRAQVPPKLPPRNGGSNVGEDQVVTIGNKALITKGKDIPHFHQVKNASIVEITMKEFSNKNMMMSSHGGTNNDTNAGYDDDALWENGIPTKVREVVIVFRLPGERLGFALKFDGGTAAAAQKVNHLYIQSCAEGSPAKRTTTSWGHLREGDEIVEIEKIPVNSMTRMDCVQALKDSSVAVQLLIEHAYSQEELQILHELQKSESSEMKDSKMKYNANKRERHPASSNCNAGSGIPTFHKQTKETLVQNNNKEMYQKSGAYSTETGNSEKGMISNNPNQRVTSNQQEGVEYKKNKSSEMTEAASSETHGNTNASLSTKCDTSEIKFDDDEIGTGRSHSRIPIKRGQATLSLSKSMKGKHNNASASDCNEYADNNNAFANSRKGEERLDELQLQPPVGFEDELHHSQHFSVGQSNYYDAEGRNKSENVEFVNDRHYKANEASNENFIESSEEDMTLLHENHQQYQHNVMDPESMAISNSNMINAAGSTNGNNQNVQQSHHHHLHRMSSNGSNSSLNNSNSFVHLTGNENLSISTWSDETESTRSTVVSRLSIGSSMTSISAGMAVPACCSGGIDSNNNQVTLTQISESANVNNNNHGSNCHHKRKSSPNASLTSHCSSTHGGGGGVVMGLDSLKPHGVDERTNKKQNSLNHQQHHETDLHHYQHLQQQVGQQVQDRSVNNVTTIPYSSVCSRPSVTMPSEIPLEPPLSFQDQQEQVSKRRGYAFAADHKTQTFSSNIITAANGATPSIHSENQDEKASLAENSNDANDVAGGLMMAKTNVSSSLQMHQQKIQEQQSAMSAQSHHQHQPCVNNYGFGGGTRKEYFGGGGDSTNNNDSFNGTGNSRAISIMDGNNNEQEIFDDDELALLADELGLDQEDEDLFKAMLAEVEAADELEEYGPIISSPSPSASSVAAQVVLQQGDLGKVDQQIMMKANNTLIDDLKQEKSNCERNQRENVVSAKLGTVHKNYRSGANNNVTVDASDVIAFAVNDNGNNNYNKNILRNDDDETATVRIDCMVVAASKHPKVAAAVGQQCEVESWTISNSDDSRDVRGLGRIAITEDDSARSGGETCDPLRMSGKVKSAKEIVRVNNPCLMKQERNSAGGGELYKATKTNDSCALNVTGSSDNKGLIDEGCNGNFESSSLSSLNLQEGQQQQLPQYNNKSYQHTQHLQQPPARSLCYHKDACKQGNECKNGTIILQNEKVVEPIMDKRFAERNQIVLLTSQQETSVTSITRTRGDDDHNILSTRDTRGRHHDLGERCANTNTTSAAFNANNNLDDEDGIIAGVAATTSQATIVSSPAHITQEYHTYHHQNLNENARSKVSQVKMLSQESSSKMTLFVAGIPVSANKTQGEKLEWSRFSSEISTGNKTCEDESLDLPPSPPRRAKGGEKRSSFDANPKGGLQLNNQKVSKNSGEAGGTGEQAVEKIKEYEKLVASDVHSTTRHNSLQPGLSNVNSGGNFSSPSTSTAKGISSSNNTEVINNKEGTTDTTDNNKNYDGKTNNSSSSRLTSSSTSSNFSCTGSSSVAVTSVTSSLVKNSSESTAFGGPTGKNADSNQQTGDDRISSSISTSSSSCPRQQQHNKCSISLGNDPQIDSTLVKGTTASCRSSSSVGEVVVVVDSSTKPESLSYFKGNSQQQTLLSSSSLAQENEEAATSSSSLSQEVASAPRQAGSSAPDTSSSSQRTMDSSTEVLHQYIPPTFSRLPPDGDEFPNSWSDEQQQSSLKKFETRKVFRSELNLREVELEGAPPPLPTTGPPVDDSSSQLAEDVHSSTNVPPLPVSMPPLPPKPIATRQSSIDDKRKLFESCTSQPLNSSNNNKTSLQYRNSASGASSLNSTNGSSTSSSPTMSRSATMAAEPSKKSVKDKIAMFSNRTSSSEDAPDFAAKPPTGAVVTSSLKKSTLANNTNGSLSRSSDNILQGLTMSASSMNENGNGYRGINTLQSKINRSSLDISSFSNNGINTNNTTVVRKSSVDLLNFNTKPSPFYGGHNGSGEMRSSTLGRGNNYKYQNENGMSNGNGATGAFSPGKMSERSQSLVDVGGPAGASNNKNFRNSYHTESTITVNQNGTSSAATRYTTSSAISNGVGANRSPSSLQSNPANLAANSIMEQRRKCMTKLRGLVIPDVPPTNSVAHVTSNSSASVVDLPTIISKDAPVILPHVLSSTHKTSMNDNGSLSRSLISRSESLDGISSSDDNSSLTLSSTSSTIISQTTNSAKMRASQKESDLPDWKLTTNALPKYSPAFKRRSLTAYQSSGVNKSSILTSPKPFKATTQQVANNSNTTPEPKSLESLTSPRSDSSFEFSGSSALSPCDSKQADVPAVTTSNNQPIPAKRTSYDRTSEKPQPQTASAPSTTVEETTGEKVSPTKNNANAPTKGKYDKGGKLDDSDNDSAVSSSRSSISHGLSPPNSPTPGESSTTPDPDLGGESNRGEETDKKVEEGEDPSDEGWRILKPQSVEAINRKNVLTSAKYSSGGGTVGDDSSISSSNGKNRRSDDEEASYADAETEDTESSCSELDVGKTRRRMIVAGRVNLSQRRNSKVDTEEEDYEELEEQIPAHLQPVNLPSEQGTVDLGDNLVLPGLTEDPLQAIYDMEVKMAYINEVCDALPGSGRSDSSSRYFSRRDSEATVIERPIEPKRKLSMDMIDSAADRRARNRSSSGNESDFSSGISQRSTLSRSSRDRETGKPETTDRWSLLEKKYSRSMTAVNLVAAKTSEPVALSTKLTPAASVPKIVTGTGEVVEKKIEKIIEKTVVDGSPKKLTNASIPRGRNDFRSLAEKWQQISGDGKSTGSPPPVGPKPSLSRQNSTSSSSSVIAATAMTTTTSPNKSRVEPAENTADIVPSSTSPETTMKEVPISPVRSRPAISPKPTSTSPVKSSTVSNMTMMESIEADAAWAEKRRSDMTKPSASRLVKSPNPEPVPMGQTKRSVSVNDIRRAFEKAETAVGQYGRDDNSPTAKKDPTTLTLPSTNSAHFRVSSFDSTTSEESSATTPAGIYGSVNSLVSSAPRDPYGSITSLASSTSLISPQELQQLIDEANQSLEEAGTPSHEVSVVILHREFVGGSLGITLAGGADYETKEITVHKVITGSIADRDARVLRGDRVLSINGKSTKGLTHREALTLLKAPRTEVVLVVSRGRTNSNGFKTIDETTITLDRAVEPLLNGSLSSLLEHDDDTIYKWGPLRTACLTKDGAGLGFSLEGGKGSISGDRPLTVKKIFVGGPAEKSGDMKVGDLIVSINGVSMSTKSRTEAWNFMKKLSDGEVKLAIRTALA